MNIKEKFIELTSRTYPHGTEQEIYELLNSDLNIDEFGNYFLKIGYSDVMFTSHIDTSSIKLTKITHDISDDIIKTDGKSILGADDKAGVTIMLYMIENKIPGLYYFFIGEETGCIGSKKVSDKFKDEKRSDINKVISFDRRGVDSIITFQSGRRCCSDKFGESLLLELNNIESTFNYKVDPTGSITDSAKFTDLYPECTNISVGYQNEHTYFESQDINHLEKLAKACLLVKWNDLPVERNPTKIEYRSYDYDDYSRYSSYRNYSGYYDDDYNEYDYNGKYNSSKKLPISNSIMTKELPIWFMDDKFEYLSKITLNNQTKSIIKVDLCKDRINYEKSIIKDLLNALGLDYKHFIWNGFTLKIFYKQNNNTSTCDRNDIIQYLPELDYISKDVIDSENARINSSSNFTDYIEENNNLLLNQYASDIFD